MEKTALLASMYGGLRTAGRGAKELGQVLSGRGRTPTLDTYTQHFKRHSGRARNVTKGTLGRAIAETVEPVARVLGVPGKARKKFVESVVDVPTNVLIPIPYPGIKTWLAAPHVVYSGTALGGNLLKHRILKTPHGKHILRKAMNQKAVRKGFKDWDQMLDMQSTDPNSLIANLIKINKEGWGRVKKRGGRLLELSEQLPKDLALAL